MLESFKRSEIDDLFVEILLNKESGNEGRSPRCKYALNIAEYSRYLVRMAYS